VYSFAQTLNTHGNLAPALLARHLFDLLDDFLVVATLTDSYVLCDVQRRRRGRNIGLYFGL